MCSYPHTIISFVFIALFTSSSQDNLGVLLETENTHLDTELLVTEVYFYMMANIVTIEAEPYHRGSREYNSPTWQEWKPQELIFSFVENGIKELKGNLLIELPWEAGMRLEPELPHNPHATSWLFYLFMPFWCKKIQKENSLLGFQLEKSDSFPFSQRQIGV